MVVRLSEQLHLNLNKDLNKEGQERTEASQVPKFQRLLERA